LRENAPEIIEEKKVLRDTLTAEIKESMERETANLVALRNTYKLFNESKDDLFCFKQMFNAVQDDIKAQFDNTANIIKTIKKASEAIASLPNNMLKTPNLVGRPQSKP
jgi:MoxR-like ATPase